MGLGVEKSDFALYSFFLVVLVPQRGIQQTADDIFVLDFFDLDLPIPMFIVNFQKSYNQHAQILKQLCFIIITFSFLSVVNEPYILSNQPQSTTADIKIPQSER